MDAGLLRIMLGLFLILAFSDSGLAQAPSPPAASAAAPAPQALPAPIDLEPDATGAVPAEQIRELQEVAEMVDLTAQIQDFSDTAALMMELDLIISVDTAVAHLAGAMGRPVWVLVPFAPDWRWGLKGETTPWYPTARLFRQTAPGDWDGRELVG